MRGIRHELDQSIKYDIRIKLSIDIKISDKKRQQCYCHYQYSHCQHVVIFISTYLFVETLFPLLIFNLFILT